MSTVPTRRTAFFAGSFNPFTVGHASVVERALALFDAVVIGFGINGEKGGWQAAEAVEAVRALYACEPRVSVAVYDGLTAEAARQAGACALVRGVRSAADFDYESAMAQANRRLFGLETVLLVADPAVQWVSASLVRDLRRHGARAEADSLLPHPPSNPAE